MGDQLSVLFWLVDYAHWQFIFSEVVVPWFYFMELPRFEIKLEIMPKGVLKDEDYYKAVKMRHPS